MRYTSPHFLPYLTPLTFPYISLYLPHTPTYFRYPPLIYLLPHLPFLPHTPTHFLTIPTSPSPSQSVAKLPCDEVSVAKLPCGEGTGNLVIGFISHCVGDVIQSMHLIASYMDFDFKLLQQCGSQTKPLGSLRWNLQVEEMNSGESRGECGKCTSYFQQCFE